MMFCELIYFVDFVSTSCSPCPTTLHVTY